MQLLYVLRKAVRSRNDVAAKSASGGLVSTWSTAEPEIDTVWIERGKRPELFGDNQRRMIRQHDAVGADADGLGASSDVANDRRGCAGDARHVVMFRHPKPFVTPDFRVLREIERVAQRDGCGRALGNL